MVKSARLLYSLYVHQSNVNSGSVSKCLSISKVCYECCSLLLYQKKKQQGLLLKCYQYPYVVTIHTPASQMGAMNS